MLNKLSIIALLLLFAACSKEAEKIQYGKDQCVYCKMTIVDLQHSAQYVSTKGRQFKFDAIECMINELYESRRNETAQLLVADYPNPGSMISASDASFIICPEIKSPMGAFLSAFSSQTEAQKTIATKGGEIYNWPEIKRKFNEN